LGRSRLQNKNLDKERMSNTKVYCPWHKKFFASQAFLQVLLLTGQLPKITKEGLQEAEGLQEEAKVSSFLWLDAFPLELVPLQMLQDHRDGDAEALGAGVFYSFHQTVPGGLQVVVPVGHI
jgi:hypothetical protein